MRSNTAEPYLRWDRPHTPRDPAKTATSDLAVGIAHLIAGAAMSILGPLFWAAIVLGLISDMLGINLIR